MAKTNESQSVSLTAYLLRSIIPAAVGALVLSWGLLRSFGIDGGTSGYWLGIVCMGLCGALLGAGIGFLNYKRFVRPMNGIIKHIRHLAVGDLSRPLDVSKIGMLKPIGDSVNRLTENLRSMMTEANRTSEQVSAFSETLKLTTQENTIALHQVAESIQQTTGENQTQAVDLESTFEAVRVIHNGVVDITEKMGVVSEKSAQMTSQAESGRDALHDVVFQMNQIRESVQASQSTVNLLNERIQSISQTMQMINKVASQTNMLALNAAIEASRAGEYGKGFVVVSTEIRKLADQSKSAASKISEILAEIQQDSTQSIHLLDKESNEVAVGIQMLEQSSRTLENIHELTGQVAQAVQHASQDIDAISGQSTDMQERMDRMTGRIQTSFAETEKVAASIEELLASTESIEHFMEQLHETAVALERNIHEFKA